MASIELLSPVTETLDVVLYGGGSAGKTAIGYKQGMQAHSPDTQLNINVIITTGDDGGASGEISELTGQVATGDVRRSLSAVSADEAAAVDFEHRFNAESTTDDVRATFEQLYATLTYNPTYMEQQSAGAYLSEERKQQILDMTVDLGQFLIESRKKKLENVALGHLVLTALAIESDIDQATEESGRLLLAQANIIPAVTEKHRVKLRDGDKTVIGEHNFDEAYKLKNPDDFEISLCYDDDGLQTDVKANPRAVSAAKGADISIIGPGSMLGSNLQAIASRQVRDALGEAAEDADRDVIVLSNIKHTDDTEGLTVHKFADAHSRAIGASINAVIGNSDIDGIENPLVLDEERLQQDGDDFVVIQQPVRKKGEVVYPAGDLLAAAGKRSDVEHDMDAVVRGMLEYRATKAQPADFELVA